MTASKVSKNGTKIKKVTDTIKTNNKSISKAQINVKSNLKKGAIKPEPSDLNAVESDSIEFKGDDDRVADESDDLVVQVLVDDSDLPKKITKAPQDISRVKKKRSHDAKLRRRKHAKELKKQARKSAQETTDP